MLKPAVRASQADNEVKCTKGSTGEVSVAIEIAAKMVYAISKLLLLGLWLGVEGRRWD